MMTILFCVDDKERGSKGFQLSSIGSDAIEFAKIIISEFSEFSSLILKYKLNENEVIWYRAQMLEEFLDALKQKNFFYDEKLLTIHVSPPRKRELEKRILSTETTQSDSTNIDDPQEKRIKSGKQPIKIVRDYYTQSMNNKMVKFPNLELLPYPQLSKCDYNKELEKTLCLNIENFARQFKTFPKQFQNLAKQIAMRMETQGTCQIENIDISIEILLSSLAFTDDKTLPENEKLLRSVLHLVSGLETVIDPAWFLSLDSIQQIHGNVMKTDSLAFPGIFRISSIGGVGSWQAPHASKVSLLMENLILFHDNIQFSMVLKAIICHLQFEAIHPFHDGNGRIGRLLLFHSLSKILDYPSSILVCFISTEIMKQRSSYYKRLSACQSKGKVKKFIDWFLGVISTAITNSNTFIAKLENEVGKLPKFDDTNLISNGAIAVSNLSPEFLEYIQKSNLKDIFSIKINKEEIFVLSFLPTLLNEFCNLTN